MIKVAVSKIQSEYPVLSQAARLGVKDFPVTPSRLPVTFTRTLMASMTADYLRDIGTGHIDPISHTKTLMQYAMDKGISVEVLASDFYTYLKTWIFNKSAWTGIAAYICGSMNRIVDMDKLAQMPADIILDQVRKLAPHPEHDIFHYVLTDYISGMLAPLGIIGLGSPYVYRVARTPVHPNFRALVDVQAGAKLKYVLTGLANTDVGALKAMVEKKKKLHPAVLASILNEGAVAAWDRSRAQISPRAIVIASLTTFGRVWDAEMDKAGAIGDRVYKSAPFEELRVNLGLFLAYQDMRSELEAAGQLMEMDFAFNDEEMQTQILPAFYEALTEVSPFSMKHVSDAISMTGMLSTRRPDGYPGDIVIYESWDVSSEVLAFVPTRIAASNPARFLDLDVSVTDRLTAGLKSIMSTMSTDSFAKARIAHLSLEHPMSVVPKEGTTITLGTPSLIEFILSRGGDSDAFIKYLKGAELAVTATGDLTVDSQMMKWQGFSAYASHVHLAVAKTAGVHIAPVPATKVAGASRQLYLLWEAPTSHLEGIGNSVSLYRKAVSSQPLEAVCYAEDFSPMATMKTASPNIDAFAEKLHIWDYRKVSVQIEYTSSYITKVRGRNYNVTVSAERLLGEESARPRLMYMRSPMAKAIVSMWVEWFKADIAWLDEHITKAKDNVSKKAYEAAKMEGALDLLRRLVHIGTHGFGASVAATVDSALRTQLVGTKFVDDRSDLAVGLHRAMIDQYAGLVALEFLDLIDVSETSKLRDLISETGALSTWAALQYNPVAANTL